MGKVPTVWRFVRSRSGRGFLLHLSICAVLSVAVGYGFYYFSLNWFKDHKSSEKITALQLVDAFVTNYSAIRSQFGEGAPVPASFRAHAIEDFARRLDGEIVEVDALDRDFARAQRLHAIVQAACECQPKTPHIASQIVTSPKSKCCRARTRVARAAQMI